MRKKKGRYNTRQFTIYVREDHLDAIRKEVGRESRQKHRTVSLNEWICRAIQEKLSRDNVEGGDHVEKRGNTLFEEIVSSGKRRQVSRRSLSGVDDGLLALEESLRSIE